MNGQISLACRAGGLKTLQFKKDISMKHLIQAFDDRPLVDVKDMRYLLTPLTDQVPATSYEVVADMIEELSKLSDFSRATKILGEEDRGGYIASLMAYAHKLPFGMVKWNPNGLEGQIAIDFRMAYAGGKMFLNGIDPGDKVIIVEDMVDSGGTIIAMIELLRQANVDIVDIIAVAEREERQGVDRIKRETGYDVKRLLKFNTLGERSKVTWIRDHAKVEVTAKATAGRARAKLVGSA